MKGLLPDCRVSVKKKARKKARAKTIQVECVDSMHGNLLSELCYMLSTGRVDDPMTPARQAVSDRQQNVQMFASGIAQVLGMTAFTYQGFPC